MKVCSRCSVEKVFSEFTLDPTKKGGYAHQCKSCRNEVGAQRYVRKREEILAKKLAYRSENRHLAREYTAAWSVANPMRRQAARAAYRARKRGADGSFSVADVALLMRLQRGRCAACSANLKAGYHVDHLHPLALGGSNDRTNLQLLCPSCNLSKGPKDPIVFAQERGRLL